jgi:hypothetical protein
MLTASQTREQINALVKYLVHVGLAGDQNFAFQRAVTASHTEITFTQAEHVSIALKDRSYHEIYAHLAQERAYNAKMPDGAMIQMMYVFNHGSIERHRLAFLPPPSLEEFQNNPEIYLQDEIYADIIARSIVPFPVRFDYDGRDGIHQPLTHPKSHLTLGQYENCRIPVTAPMSPFWFIDFILRNFYHTAFNRYAEKLPKFGDCFRDSIHSLERGVVHVIIPPTTTGQAQVARPKTAKRRKLAS